MNNETASAALAEKTYRRCRAKRSACAIAEESGEKWVCCVCICQ